MEDFILHDDRVIWVNVNQIVSVTTSASLDNLTLIDTTSGSFFVKNTVEEVASKINDRWTF